MNNKIKKRLVSNRCVYKMVYETSKYKGVKKTFIRLLRGIMLIFSREFWSYGNEIKDIEKNGNIFEFEHLGKQIKVYIPLLRSDDIQKNIVIHRDFFEAEELDLLKGKYISDQSVIVDIGANIGNHAIYYGAICNARKVYSFEPMQETFLILEKNVEINNLSNIVSTYNVALGRGGRKSNIQKLSVF